MAKMGSPWINLDDGRIPDGAHPFIKGNNDVVSKAFEPVDHCGRDKRLIFSKGDEDGGFDLNNTFVKTLWIFLKEFNPHGIYIPDKSDDMVFKFLLVPSN